VETPAHRRHRPAAQAALQLGGTPPRPSSAPTRRRPRRVAAPAHQPPPQPPAQQPGPLPPAVSTPLFHDQNTQRVGKSQSRRPQKMWKRQLTCPSTARSAARPSARCAHSARQPASSRRAACTAAAAAVSRAGTPAAAHPRHNPLPVNITSSQHLDRHGTRGAAAAAAAAAACT
jgi:hypothetical protein